MAEEKNKQSAPAPEQFKTMIGGQALIEGILMRGPRKQAVVVRTPEGLVEKVEDLHPLKDRCSVFGWPLIRGIVNFFDSLLCGIKALIYSADFFPEEEGEPDAMDRWLEKHFKKETVDKLVVPLGMVLGVVFAVALFLLLPTFLVGLVPGLHDRLLLRNLAEGVVKIAIFIGYLAAVSKMPDMRRVFSYHGAEHKTIRCYEARLPLTVENVRPMTRLHPRCGTSFLFVVLFISILLGTCIQASNTLLRAGMKLLLLPVVVAVAYEINRFVGRHDTALTRIITAPGLWLQNFTTNEPDDSMIEVGIAALQAVLPDLKGQDAW